MHKSLEITATHFKELYENVSFDYFVYDSRKLSDVRNFATSPDIQIMVINIEAFRKSFTDPEKENKANIIHRSHDRMTGAKPIEYIQETNPIVGSPYKTMRVNKINRLHLSAQNCDLIKSILYARLLHAF